MSTPVSSDVSVLIDQLKEQLGVRTDVELADSLGLQKTAIAQWRRRNRVPTHVEVRLERPRAPHQPLYRGPHEEAFPDVVGLYALAIALLLTPSMQQPCEAGAEWAMRQAVDAASFFDDYVVMAAAELGDTMASNTVEVEGAFRQIIHSPERMARLRKRIDALYLPQ